LTSFTRLPYDMDGTTQSNVIIDRAASQAACCGGEIACSAEQPAVDRPGTLPPREACPPPLLWQQVVTAFREESESWEMWTTCGMIRGRAWGDGPTLVFLNGLDGTCELFTLCAYLLKAQFRCVLFDGPTGRQVTWGRLCDSVAEMVAKFSAADGCHLFGTSLGSALTLETTVRLGSRVRTATLHAAFAHLRLTVFERLAARVLQWLPGRMRSVPYWRALQDRSHRLWFPPIDPTRWEFYLDNAGQTPIATLAQRFGMLRKFDFRSRLSDLQTPVLLLHVEGEGAVQTRCREELAAALPNSHTEFLHTTGLLAYLTHPHRLAKLIREFVASTDSMPSNVDESVARVSTAS
jgi:pimeloyl-ACP methyl ester carboxylesterase